MRVLVTGGAGFIGSAVIRHLIKHTEHEVFNFDALTYAGNLESLKEVENNPRYLFAQLDLRNKADIEKALSSFKPDWVMHLAAESHVDRSIDGPDDFIETNIVGTYNLLQACREHLSTHSKPDLFRFHHISTDEVFGSLGQEGLFTESTPYQPNSPYSASKAASDHLVRAWHHTFAIPTLVTNCSNNYGPFHFPEKLIPLMIIKALRGEELPIYGNGENIRDWLYVEDHAKALVNVVEHGTPGETYNIGGSAEMTNLEVVHLICDLVDQKAPQKSAQPRRSLIKFVADRPGHDLRYAIDHSKVTQELGFKPSLTFREGLSKTIAWYMENEWWWQPILANKYKQNRLGLTHNSNSGAERPHS